MQSVTGKIRAGYRLVLFAVCTLVMVIMFAITGIGQKDKVRHGILWRRRWLNYVPRWMGIRMHVEKLVLPEQAAIYMSNHRSYLDPVIVLSQVDAVVVAKQEVARWPLIGPAARIAGVLFVRRGHSDSRKDVLGAIARTITSGLPVLNFPEGTTAQAPMLKPFRAGAFELAAQQDIPVVPVALEYMHRRDAWIDDDTFLRHFFQMFSRKYIDVHVCLGPLLRSRDAQWLMSESRNRMRQALNSYTKLIVDA